VDADIPAEGRPSEPGLDVLLSLLTAEPTPDELAGQGAAVRMFLANTVQPDTAELEPGPGAGAPRPRVRRLRLLAGAGTVAAAAGLVVAAYAGALPASWQNAASHVLGFAGVPQAHPARTASHGAPPGPAHGSQPPGGAPSPGAPASAPAGPSPAAPSGTSLSLVGRGRVVAGTGDVFLGRLTDHGQPVADVVVTLLERPAGQSAWQIAGTAMTGNDGVASVSVSDLTTNAGFELTGPGGAQSREVLVVVVPPVSARITSGPRGQPGTLTASSPLAEPGDTVVLQTLTSSGWASVQAGRLGPDSQAEFPVRLPAGHRYRVVLLPTALHGLSVSNTAAVPAR
jgi:hypothetical protein